MARFLFRDLDALVKAAGVQSDYGQSGGGCCTLYAGPTIVETDTGATWYGKPVDITRATVAAGPGSYRGPDSFADTDEFYIGPDDDGEADPVKVAADWTVAEIAAEIVRQVRALTP